MIKLMNMQTIRLSLAILGMLFALGLVAAQTARAIQPLVTDDADTEGKGGILVEFSNELSFDRQKIDGETLRARDNETTLTLSYGLLDNLDLILEVPYLHARAKFAGETESENGLGDLGLEVKWRFHDSNLAALALVPAITLPTGDEDRGLGSGKVSYGLTFIATKEFDPIDVHLNLGYAHNRFKLVEDRVENRRDIWSASVAAVHDLTPRLDLVADIGIERHEVKGSSLHPAFGLAGLVFALRENLDLDAGVKFGLSRSEPDFALLVGLTWAP
ncbi:transporter [Geoalkalibacter halelectricus]|uniref:Transporter n=1 Tax=Geoalkalibacter halelectricus TaxID=2847045 RepID=A0ABY5ZLN0_9BACT|nr:transporter [Geoalkalibacter halelectricus]MDO3376862.1 transporter [Geoalkalibacter halelectricus]UWZ79616.1 transporter [Geoalkalibacter halelectricus]